jgi:hypothetical protein
MVGTQYLLIYYYSDKNKEYDIVGSVIRME